MRVHLTASAPGKLVLLGEYAVLFGAPAAVLAVDRRARVDLAPASGELWSVLAPPLLSTPVDFELTAGGRLRWTGARGDRLPLVDRVVGAMVASGMLDPGSLRPATVTLDTRPFYARGATDLVKLGLGSSAALTVALASALAWWAGRTDLPGVPDAWLDTLVALHRSLQGGHGSGIDLAASLFGGVVEYRLDPLGSVAVAEHLRLPADLELLFVWTGRAADTRGFLEQLDLRLRSDDGTIAHALDRLKEASRTGVEALRTGRSELVLDAVDAFGSELEALGRTAGLPILSDEHVEMGRIARRIGAHYKPSGAGGGDVGIAFTNDPEIAAATGAAAEDAGFRVLDLRLTPDGLRLDRA